MTQATAQVIERNEDLFPNEGSYLFIEPPSEPTNNVFAIHDVVTFNYRTYKAFEEFDKENIVFGIPETGDRYDGIILFMPKSKPELELYLDLAASVLADHGKLYLLGEKKSGIASGAKRLAAHSKECVKIDSAKHCQLWEASGVSATNAFDIQDYFEVFDFQLDQENKLQLAALPGVFASGRLDEGTALLLEQDIRRLKGRTLDFGCGCGVISVAIKTLNPDIDVESIDINWFALETTKKTLSLNGLTASVYASDGWDEVKGRVNGVVTNPPFHQGVSTEYMTTESFIKTAKDKMARYAPMYIVANNFLRYPELITSVFGRCSDVGRNNKFAVYYCER
ncbi:MAG: class I SAM-dependent methyltransferase [Oleiphilaceae bacterium]|nr:class I SAM-dependent methyltransferase [Oleiphilaceae bacterium]